MRQSSGVLRDEARRDELGDVFCADLFVEAFVLDAVTEHGQAERTCRTNRVRVLRQPVLEAVMVDALSDVLFHPKAAAAGAAANAAITVVVELDDAQAWDRAQHFARLFGDAVVARQIA